MSRYIPVLPEKWAKMVRCWAENVRLETEVAQLKTELERVRLEQKMNAVPVEAKLMDSIAKLQTDNDHLEANNQRMSREYCDLADDHSRLKAEVERLTKAGDLLCRMAGNNQVINRHWKTAKKGVQS